MPRHLHYGSTIVLQSAAFGGYQLTGGIGGGAGPLAVAFSQAQDTRVRWYVLNPSNRSDTSLVRFGDVVALSCVADPRRCLSVGPVPAGPPVRSVSTVNALGPSQQWRLIDPHNPDSRETVAWGVEILVRNHTDGVCHLSCGWGGTPPAPLGAAAVPQTAAWEILRPYDVIPTRITGVVASRSPSGGLKPQTTEGAGGRKGSCCEYLGPLSVKSGQP
jgi:hypothetical protein